jgi:SAM-dependent methyltransferase
MLFSSVLDFKSQLQINPMHTDILDLHHFYTSPRGRAVRRVVRAAMRGLWPDVKGQTVLGIGYATPYLRLFERQAQTTIAFMPAASGVTYWPLDGDNRALIGDEARLPFADASIDRILLVHALETTEQTQRLLAEAWRVLTAGGRLLVVVPNRSGFWSGFDGSPLGNGIPYSPAQIRRLLLDNRFTPEETREALFMPPLPTAALPFPLLDRLASLFERVGKIGWPYFSGVVLMEARKQLYAPIARRQTARTPGFILSIPRLSPPSTSALS